MTETKKQYRIEWTSRLTQAKGHGEWMDDYNAVASCASKANRDYPDIKHRVVERELPARS